MQMNRIWSHLQGRSNTIAFAVAVVLVSALAALERSAGDFGSLWTLYLAPVALAAWIGRERGAAVAVVAVSAAWVWFAYGGVSDTAAASVVDRLVQIAVLAAAGIAVAAWSRSVADQVRDRRSDALTGLANGPVFFHHLDAENSRAQRYGRPFTIAHVGVGNLRGMMQRSGSEAGEALLRDVASILTNQLRAVDVVARLRGGEFAVLLPETDVEGATTALNRTMERLQALAADAHPGAAAQFNIGALTCAGSELSVEQLFQRVYQLMYVARQEGPGVIEHEVLGLGAALCDAGPER
jgi:diguanylate cyclase (GGDEF)-like protein